MKNLYSIIGKVSKTFLTISISCILGMMLVGCNIKEKTIVIDDKNAEYYYQEGRKYITWGLPTDAIENFDKAIERDPNNYEYYGRRAQVKYYNLAYKEALEDINKAISINLNKSCDEYSLRASVRLDLKDYKGALEDIDICLALEPNDISSLSKRGEIKFFLKDYKGALEDIERVINSKNKYSLATAYYFRALIRLEKNNKTGALEDINNCLKVQPGYVLCQELNETYR